MQVQFTVNGRAASVDVPPNTLLVHALREHLQLTGTHVGCDTSQCGACTVQIDGVAGRSCLTLALQVDGRRVDTVEGLCDGDGPMSDLQEAFKRHHALQCGFCTAGILMSCDDYLKRVPDPSEAQVRDMLSGHLCRCTGYTPIVAAVLEAASLRRQAATTPHPGD